MRSLAATLLLGALLFRAEAAPAPPARVATAEAVVALAGADPQEVVKKLYSRAVLEAITRSEKARQLRCMRLENDPGRWLAARLKTSVDEKRGLLTIRVEGCPKRDVLPLLWAVVEAYKSHACHEQPLLAKLHLRYEKMRMLHAHAAITDAPVRQAEAQIRAVQARVGKLLLQPPQLVPAGR